MIEILREMIIDHNAAKIAEANAIVNKSEMIAFRFNGEAFVLSEYIDKLAKIEDVKIEVIQEEFRFVDDYLNDVYKTIEQIRIVY